MANDGELILVSQRGWRRGLNNLLDNEFGRWWRTRRWWVQALIWTALIGFLLGSVVLKGGVDFATATLVYSIFASMFPAVAVIIAMQSALVGEKASGTAAWVLSKPVSRPAFVLAKLVANGLSVLVTTVFIPGLVAYPMLSRVMGGLLNPLLFLAGLGVIWLALLWYLAFTLMLGALLKSRGAVIGIALAVTFFQQYLLGFLPQLKIALPWTLTAPVSDVNEVVVPLLLQGKPVAAFLPQLIIIFAEIVLFVVLAVWRFRKEEL
jgi:ABC-2 type transport system permease protein